MATLPFITYRYPLLSNGAVSELKPQIIFDWSTDVVDTQFSDAETLAKFVILLNKDTGETIALDFSSYDPYKHRVTLVPRDNLDRQTRYTVIVNDKVADSSGRKSSNQYRWEFTTDAAVIEKVTLYSPSSDIVATVFPTLKWVPVSASGNVYYQVVLDDTFEFSSPEYSATLLYNQPASGQSSPLSTTPAGSFEDDTTYYWRVRAYTATATGSWSETYSFYFGAIRNAHVTSSETWNDDVPFQFSKVSFRNGLSNQGAFPTITVTFTQPLASMPNFEIQKETILPRNDKPASFTPSVLAGTWTGSGGVYTFTPSEDIAENTKYNLIIPAETEDENGNELGQDISYYWTGKYNPFYINTQAIRAKFMSSQQRIPDDYINYNIYRASLDAKARFYGWSMYPTVDSMFGDALKESFVRDSNNLQSYGTLKWVEAAATYYILHSLFKENLNSVGRTRKQGDYEESLTKDYVTAMKMALDEAKEELDMWDNYMIPSDIPMTVSRGRTWSDAAWDADFSVNRIATRDSI